MTLVLINGISTSGKSTLARELTMRGYEAYDTERNGISAWYNIKSDKRVAEFGGVSERTREWMDAHEFRMSMDWAKNIANEASRRLIFLCGAAANGDEVRQLCDKVFWLKTDEMTIRHRLTIPREHTYGTKPHEFERILDSNVRNEDEYRKYGAVIIDATQTIDDVVTEVIRLSVG